MFGYYKHPMSLTLSPFSRPIADMKSVHGVSSVPSLGHFAVAVSSIAMHLGQFLARENVELEMIKFATRYEYSLVVLMGINTNAKGKLCLCLSQSRFHL